MSAKQLIEKRFSRDASLSKPAKSMQTTGDVKVDQPNYTSFAFFMSLVYMTTFFSHPDNPIPHLYSWLISIKGVGTMLCVGLLIEPYWPIWLKQRFTAYWYFTLFYCLPFAFTLLLLLNAYSVEWIVCLSLAFTLLLVLVNWRIFVALTLVGIALALVLYRIWIGPLPLLAANNLYLLMYSCTFSIVMGLIFVLRKEQSLRELKLQNQQLAEEQQRNRQEMIDLLQYKKVLLEELPTQLDLDDENDADQGVTAYIQQIIYRMADYMRLEVTSITVSVLEQTIKEVYQFQGPHRPLLLFKQDIQPTAFEADLGKLKQLLRNSLHYIQQHNQENHPVMIAVEDAMLGHDVLHMPDYTRMLEALRITITIDHQLPPVKPLYKIDFSKPNSVRLSQQPNELSLVENARIMDAHYGYMDVSNSRTHLYVIPVHLRDIRGKVMELLREPAVADPEELKHPLAIQLEKKLLEKLEGTQVDINLIKTALDVIKKYHGGVKRKSGEPFFTHPINVALILLEYSQEQDAILGALLHDTIEDTSLTLAQVRQMFGKRVAFLVAKATNLEEYRNRISLPDYENIIRIMNYEDPLAALVKLSDRLHNMRTIQHHPKLSKQKLIAQETLKYFVPLAKELKLGKMAEELERLSQEVMAKKE